MTVLPPGWLLARFGDVVRIDADLVDPKSQPDAPHVAPNHIESKTGRLLPYSTVAEDGVKSPKHRFRPGQVLYSKIRPYLAKAALVDFSGLCSADMYPLSTELDARYLLRWILSDSFTQRVSQDQGRTVLPKVNQAALSKIEIPIPPLGEQRRIAERLEAQLARSRNAQRALEAALPLLDRLRHSILAAAFRGDLTADWRATNSDVEPADELLARIRAERRARWAASEAVHGRGDGGDGSKTRYKEADPLDDSGLPQLPERWRWAAIGELLDAGGLAYGVLKPGDPYPSGVPMIRVMDIGDGMLADTELMRISPALANEFRRTRLEEGDVLLSVMATIGRTMVVPAELAGANVNRAVAVLRPVHRELLAKYLCWFFRSPFFRSAFAEKQLGTAQQRINLGDLERFAVPIPPLSEISVLLGRVEVHLSRHAAIVTVLESVVSELVRLNEATLAKAFRGELVPQDPSDEPASALLERIRVVRDRGEPLAAWRGPQRKAGATRSRSTARRRTPLRNVTRR